MYLFTFRAVVNPESEVADEFRDVGGAYVSCWIHFKDYESAGKLAEILVKEQGWIPEVRTDASRVFKRDCTTEKRSQYYAEAVKHGYTLVFDMWMKDAEDADRDYESEEIN